MNVDKRVLITGGTGFIGSHLINILNSHGYQLTALVRNNNHKPSPADVDIAIGDVTDAVSLRNAMASHDIVCHLAADYKLGPVNRRAMYATNVEGTRNVLDVALECGVGNILYVSTTAALGETLGDDKNESHRHNGTFRSYYEETKHIAHGLALDRIASGAPINIAIPGGVFGQGDQSVLAQTIRTFSQGKIPFQVKTQSRFNLCHVQPLCDGLRRIIEHNEVGNTWILAGQDFSMPELFQVLAKHYRKKVPKEISASRLSPLAFLLDTFSSVVGLDMPLSREALAVMDGSTYTYRSDKAKKELGWNAGDFESLFKQYLCFLDVTES